jgi:hypothetical protein
MLRCAIQSPSREGRALVLRFQFPACCASQSVVRPRAYMRAAAGDAMEMRRLQPQHSPSAHASCSREMRWMRGSGAGRSV